MRVEDDQDQFDQHFATAAQKPDPAPAETQPAAVEVPEPAAVVEAPAPQAPAAEAKAPAEPVPLEELQASMADLRHRERSSANRVSTFMRKNAELEQLVAEMRQKLDALQTAPAPAAPAPAADDVLTSAPDLEAAVRTRVQEAIAPLLKRVDETTGRVDQVGRIATEARQTVEPIAQQRHQETIAATHKGLDEQFTPKWREDVSSASFAEWLPSQPKWVRELHQSAVTLEDSATVMGRYYATHGRPAPTPAAPAATAAPAANPQQERLRLAAGIAPRGSARAPAGPAADDFEGHFAMAARALKTA